MLLGVKTKKVLFARHATVGILAVVVVFLFLFFKTESSFDIRFWRALGDTTFTFLFITLSIGPMSVLWAPASKLVSWRREFGIWSTLLGLAHFVRVFDFAFSEPGLEMPVMVGLTALFFAVVLMATSSDRAVNYLGASSWKWLHSFAYVVFYLPATHATYFLFFYSANTTWFRYLFLVMVLFVPVLQASAFIKTVRQQKETRHGDPENRKEVKLPVKSRRTVAHETEEVSFDITKVKFPFRAGQYIQMRIPKLLHNDDRGASRVFTIASSPNNKKELSFAFRNSGSGFKKTLLEMPIGSHVEIEGPSGFFTLPQNTSAPVVFIAGGIGITPYISMIRFATENKLSNNIILLYSNANEESAAYLEELTKIDKENPNFSLVNKFGRMDAEFIQKSVENLDDKIWYIVGPPPMVTAIRDTLSKLGIDSGKIRFEDFYGY